MATHSLPSPPAEDHKPAASSRKTNSSHTKSVKPVHRTAKRAHSSPIATHHYDHVTENTGMDGRHKRVWKACERCRMKKTKCDGEFPCKRCKDDGLVCTAGVRKKVEYKQLPRGYAEVLENTQYALIATVHKLYSMVRSQQAWDLGEPELNDRGQPVIHNIAQKLGCIRPNSDIDLPVHSVFPEDEAGLAELARQLEAQQRERDVLPGEVKDTDAPSTAAPLSSCSMPAMVPAAPPCQRSSSTSSASDLDLSDLEPVDQPSLNSEQDYRKMAFGGGNMTLSPQSFNSPDFDFSPVQSQGAFSSPSTPLMPFPAWTNAASTQNAMAMHLLQSTGGSMAPSLDMLNQGLLESDFGTLKPHQLSCPNPEVMMGMGDPMIYSGYDNEPMRL